MQPNQQAMSTNFSIPEILVLQILPEIKMGKTTVMERKPIELLLLYLFRIILEVLFLAPLIIFKTAHHFQKNGF